MAKYGLEDEITFGKHAGETIEYIIDTDLGYFYWMVHNCRNVNFDSEAFSYARHVQEFGPDCDEDDEFEDYDDDEERYPPEKEEEFQDMLRLCRRMRISSPLGLSDFITENRLGSKFPNLAGDVEFQNAETLRRHTLINGIAPEVYRRLCRKLGFTRARSKAYVIDYTPNKYLGRR